MNSNTQGNYVNQTLVAITAIFLLGWQAAL